MTEGADTLVIAAGTAEGQALDALLEEDDCRILVLSALGVHPDARAARLRKLWSLEEQVRRSSRAALTLRLAPVVGADCPLWLRLRTRPRLGRDGEMVFSPVHEGDVVETLKRALDGRARWEGWYGVAGPEVMTLAEASALAARASGSRRERARGSHRSTRSASIEFRSSSPGWSISIWCRAE